MAFNFTITHTDGSARAGVLALPHGNIQTPAFMPVGTQATVKSLSQEDLEQIGYGLILGNAYHLHLRPGPDLIERAGGLHGFMSWNRNILTDSGGYQVMSLAGMRKITDEGVIFRSHLNGDEIFFTPESVLKIQRQFNSDISMVLDECAPYPCDKDKVEQAMKRTHDWALRAVSAKGENQIVYGIVQGGAHKDLRQNSAEFIASLPFEGIAIGGVSVGEPETVQRAVTAFTAPLLPFDKPRYLMGVGRPEDILLAVYYGIDQFDCVLPTRIGRHYSVYTSNGRLNLRNQQFTEQFGPVDPTCQCLVCKKYSAAYISHLFRSQELLAQRLATYHNLAFYKQLMMDIRTAIIAGEYQSFMEEKLRLLNKQDTIDICAPDLP